MAAEPKTIYPVMVSSTYTELADHRLAVREAMPGLDLLPVAMEYDAALPDQDLIDASLSKVDRSAAYVGLISYRYGQTPKSKERNPDTLSLTELEFRRALKREIPICMFIMHDDHPVPKGAVGKESGVKQKKLKSFVNLAKKDRIYAEFKSIDDLKTKTIQSLIKLREALDKRAERRGPPAQDQKLGAKPAPEAQSGAKLALSNIPISVPRFFLGRDDALDAIDAALKRAEGRAALHGLRGVGKSTLAAAYAERHRRDYRATWWIRAQTESTTRADLVALGVRLGWVAADEKEEPAVAAVGDRLRDDGDRLLLIFDNAIQADALKPFLPKGGAAHVLVTSNAPDWSGIAAPVEIEVWPKVIGADYLVDRTGRKNERAEAEALSDSLGGLPLAHEQAAAYCGRVGISLGDYRKRLEAAPARLLDADKDAPAEYHNKLTATKAFALAIDEAAKLHPAAELLIVHAALLAPEPIPLYLFSEGRREFGEPLATLLADDGLDEAVAALRAFALVDRESTPDERDPAIATDTIRLHRLLRAAAAARCEGEAAETARRALIQAMAAVYPNSVYDDPSVWPRARRLDALALDLVAGARDPPSSVVTGVCYLLDRLATYRQGALATYAEARPLFERALAIAEKALGPEHRATASSLNNLAVLLEEQGDFAASRSLKERALAITEKALGPEHPFTATSLNNLALLHQNQGDLTSARSLHERALAIREKSLGPEHPDTATTLASLGNLYWRQNDLPRAISLYQRALSIDEKALGAEHPISSLYRSHIASMRLAQSAFPEALALGEAALAAHAKALSVDHPWTKDSARVTADALAALGRTKEAEGLRARYGLSSS